MKKHFLVLACAVMMFAGSVNAKTDSHLQKAIDYINQGVFMYAPAELELVKDWSYDGNGMLKAEQFEGFVKFKYLDKLPKQVADSAFNYYLINSCYIAEHWVNENDLEEANRFLRNADLSARNYYGLGYATKTTVALYWDYAYVLANLKDENAKTMYEYAYSLLVEVFGEDSDSAKEMVSEYHKFFPSSETENK